MLDKFAEELKHIRQSKELTLQQVAVKTRIDLKFLEAMESGDFEFLPELYVKAFVKEYIKVLGVDEQLYIKKYEAARQGKLYEEKPEPEKAVKHLPEEIAPETPRHDLQEPKKRITAFDTIRNYKRHDEESSTSRRRKKTITYYLTAGVIFFTGILYLFLFSGDDEIVVPEKAWEEVVGEVPDDEQESTADYDKGEEQVAALSPSDSLSLLIRAADTSWIRIRLDDSRTDEFILFPGSQKSIKASVSYRIIFGNARGVKLDLNGKPLSFNPKNLNVLRVQIDDGGVKELDQKTVIE